MLWTGTPALEEQVTAYEKVRGVSFPDDYRLYLSATNGGFPIQTFSRQRAANVVARLFELDSASEASNLWSAQVRYAARVPPPLMPIGLSTSGNVLCIGIFGTTRGRVFSLDLKGSTTEIARSFSDLLAIFEVAGSEHSTERHLRLVE